MSATAIAPTATQQINNYIEKKIDFSKVMTPEQHKAHAVNLMNLRFATTESKGGKRKKPKPEKPKRKRIRVKKDVDAI